MIVQAEFITFFREQFNSVFGLAAVFSTMRAAASVRFSLGVEVASAPTAHPKPPPASHPPLQPNPARPAQPHPHPTPPTDSPPHPVRPCAAQDEHVFYVYLAHARRRRWHAQVTHVLALCTMREDGTITFQGSAANQGSALGATQFRFIGVPALAKRMIQSGWTAVHAADVEQLATGRLECLDLRPAVAGQQIWPGSRRQAPASGSAGSQSSVFEQMLDEMDEMEAAPSRVLKKPRGQDTFCCACGCASRRRRRQLRVAYCF